MERLGTPLSYQNYREAEKRGDAAGADVLRNTFGVNPAKREFVRTKAQNDLIELMARRGHTALTPDAAEARQARTELLRAKRMGQDDVGLVEKAIEFGVTAKEMRTIFKRAGTMPYLERFKALSLDDAWKIFNEGTPTEQKLFRAMLRKKQTAAQQRQK
jgi:hypothetical protein